MNRLGISKNTEIGIIVSEPGVDPYERDDGLHPNNHIKNSDKKFTTVTPTPCKPPETAYVLESNLPPA